MGHEDKKKDVTTVGISENIINSRSDISKMSTVEHTCPNLTQGVD
jgi:hypothetical protein